MAKKEKANPPCCEPYKPDPAELNKRYKENYEFTKAPSVRSPVGKWESDSIQRSPEWHSPKERRLVNGTPSTFKGRRTGSVYGGKRGK